MVNYIDMAQTLVVFHLTKYNKQTTLPVNYFYQQQHTKMMQPNIKWLPFGFFRKPKYQQKENRGFKIFIVTLSTQKKSQGPKNVDACCISLLIQNQREKM